VLRVVGNHLPEAKVVFAEGRYIFSLLVLLEGNRYA